MSVGVADAITATSRSLLTPKPRGRRELLALMLLVMVFARPAAGDDAVPLQSGDAPGSTANPPLAPASASASASAGAADVAAVAAATTAAGSDDVDPAPRFRRKRKLLTNEESDKKAEHHFLRLTTGEDHVIDLAFDPSMDDSRIEIGNPAIIGAKVVPSGDKKILVIKPLKEGDTTLTLRDRLGRVKVIFTVQLTLSDLLRISGEIRNLLRDVEGIDVRIVGPKVVIDGEVLVPNDYGKLLTVVMDDAYAKNVINLTVLSPLALQVMAKKIQDDVVTFAPNVKTRVVNGMIFLEGTADSFDQAQRALSVAKLYLPELSPGNPLEKDNNVHKQVPPRALVHSFILVTPAPPRKQEKLVRVTIYFVELDKSYERVFGFKWAPGFTADPQIAIGQNTQGQTGTTTSSSPSFSATISSLIPRLQTAQNAGYARTLKTGTIIVRSGQPAKLVETTSFPVSQINQNGQQSYSSKAVGLTLAVTPTILGQSEDIQMQLELDQSAVSGPAPAAGAAPITAGHTVSTNLYVRSGESSAIGGLQGTTVSTAFNKDDPASALGSDSGGSTASLFQLLHSKNYSKSKLNFVIFVTPQIIENASDGSEDLRKNFRVNMK